MLTSLGPDDEKAYTPKNKQLLEALQLKSVTLRKLDQGHTIEVKWTENCADVAKNYTLCTYEASEGKKVLVFIATECGSPPDSLSTDGCSVGNGNLRFIASFNHQAIAFVIHPDSWWPFQKRFFEAIDTQPDAKQLLEDTTSSWTHWINKNGSSTAAGAAVGSIVPGLGTVVGAIVGFVASYTAEAMADKCVGDYCRYIGPGK